MAEIIDIIPALIRRSQAEAACQAQELAEHTEASKALNTPNFLSGRYQDTQPHPYPSLLGDIPHG